MNSTAPPLFSLEPLDAFCASLRLWLFEMAALVLSLIGARTPEARALKLFIAAEVRAVTIEARQVFLLLACAQIRARRAGRKRVGASRRPPPGFRWSRHRPSGYRLLTRVLVRGGGSLRQRLARLRDLVTRRAYWIARVVARFERGYAGPRLIAVAPAGRARASVADAPTPACADTS